MAVELYNIGEFYGITQHRDGSLLNTGTAIDARNMDTSDGNLSVAKGYERRSNNAIPTDGDKPLRLIPVDVNNILAVTQKHIYHGNYSQWNLTPIYAFETTLPVECQIGYTLSKINTTNVVLIGTGRTQIIKVEMGDTIAVELFGSGQWLYESTVADYLGRRITLADALNEEAKTLIAEKGITIKDKEYEVVYRDDTTLVLPQKPERSPLKGDKVYVISKPYTGEISTYSSKVVTLVTAMTAEQQAVVTEVGGIYIEDEFHACTVTSSTKVTLTDTPATTPTAGQKVEVRKTVYESTITEYSTRPIITLAAAMDTEQQVKLTVENGLYINDVFLKGKVTTETTVTLDTVPSDEPEVGDTAKIRGGGSTAHCNFVCMHFGRLFAAGDPEAPNRLYWSTVPGDGRTIEHWLQVSASEDLSGGYVEVGDSTADPIIGLCELSSQIVIFKRYSIWRLYGDRPSYYTVERVERFTDEMSNAGVAVKTDVPYWLTKGGIKLFDGADMQLLDGGQNIIGGFIDTVKSVSQSKGFAVRNKLYWSCRVGDGNYDDSLIVFDATNGTYMVRDGFNIADMCAFDNVIYLLNDTGYLYEFDKGDKYDGQPINAYWQTQPTDLGAKYLNKQLRDMYFRAVGGTVQIEVSNNLGVITTERRVILTEDMIDIPLKQSPSRRFSVKLYNEFGSHFSIQGGIQITYEGLVRP